ncbi:MAG: hypothetical protein Kow0042_31850 [Calditrichia bacterium]
MENLYDAIFIVDVSQNPDEVETVTSRVQQLIEDHGGIIKRIDRWGKRRLAYPINNQTHGYYVEVEFSANSRLNIPRILEAEFRLNDRVLRDFVYIMTKKELLQREKRAKKIEEAEKAEEKAAVEFNDEVLEDLDTEDEVTDELLPEENGEDLAVEESASGEDTVKDSVEEEKKEAEPKEGETAPQDEEKESGGDEEQKQEEEK